MTLDVNDLHARIFHCGANPWNAFNPSSALSFFAPIIHVLHLPIMADVTSFENVLMGKWTMRPGRLRLLHFMASSQSLHQWPTEHTEASKRVLQFTLLDCQSALGAVWGSPFLCVLDPFIALFKARPDPIFFYSAAYIAAQVEKALAEFAEIVTDDNSNGPFADERKNSIGCASILLRIVSAKANSLSWELFPCAVFFAPGGEYQAIFNPSPVHKRKGPPSAPNPPSSTKRPQSAPTPASRTISQPQPPEPCYKHLLFKLSPPAPGSPWPPCLLGKSCPRSHHLRNINGTRGAFQQAILDSSFHKRSILADAVAADTKCLSFLLA
jgi:hypothetical protein